MQCAPWYSHRFVHYGAACFHPPCLFYFAPSLHCPVQEEEYYAQLEAESKERQVRLRGIRADRRAKEEGRIAQVHARMPSSRFKRDPGPSSEQLDAQATPTSPKPDSSAEEEEFSSGKTPLKEEDPLMPIIEEGEQVWIG